MPELDFDVVIAGGGMVGASLALSLARHSGGQLRVLVVERFPLPPASGQAPAYRPSFDARSTALSYGSRQIYEALDIWPLLAQHACPISQVHVSDRGHFGSVSMRAEQQGWPALGYVIENSWLGNVLLNEVRQQAGVEFRAPATVSQVEMLATGVRLGLHSDGEDSQLSAGLLVVADGADSGLRRQLGINASVNDYAQTAFIANIASERPHGGCAYERFTEDGALALLPLTADEQGQSRSALVWTCARQRAETVAAWSDKQFLGELQTHFGFRLGRLKKLGERAQFPLQLTTADEQLRRHVVVMGNAAHSLHPVAGQGFNLALRDVAALSPLLAEAKRRGEALGELVLLQRYMQRRAADQRLTTTFSDRLLRVFGNRQPLLSLARNLGLSALDVLPPAKSRFVAQTAGMAGGL